MYSIYSNIIWWYINQIYNIYYPISITQNIHIYQCSYRTYPPQPFFQAIQSYMDLMKWNEVKWYLLHFNLLFTEIQTSGNPDDILWEWLCDNSSKIIWRSCSQKATKIELFWRGTHGKCWAQVSSTERSRKGGTTECFEWVIKTYLYT